MAFRDLISNIGSIFSGDHVGFSQPGRDRSVVVADIGSSSLKLLHGLRDGSRIVVKNVAFVASPNVMAGASYFDDASKVIEQADLRLDVLVESFSAESDRFIVSLPDNFSVIKYISLESTPAANMVDEEVRKQIEGELPHSYDSWNVVSQVIDRSDQGMNIISLATYKKNFDAISRSLGRKIAEPDYLSLSSFLSHEILYPYLESRKDENIALINMGNSNTCVSIFKGSGLRTIQSISVGGHHFTSDIAANRQCSLVEAENFKKAELFFLPEYVPQQEKLKNFGVIKNTFMELVRGIFYMFESYYTRYFEEKINEIIMFGGGSNFKNIEVLVSGLLNTPVKKASSVVKADSETAGGELDAETLNLCLPMLGAIFGGTSDESKS